MREQSRARQGFGSDLYRGGLARKLCSEASLGAALMDRAARGLEHLAGRLAGTTTSRSSTSAGAASLTPSIGSGSGVIVPGTGIHLNNMLGEYDLNPPRAGPVEPA